MERVLMAYAVALQDGLAQIAAHRLRVHRVVLTERVIHPQAQASAYALTVILIQIVTHHPL
jgi:hypothetical protein